MGNLKKNISDKLEIFENVLGSLDKVFGGIKPYNLGTKTGNTFSNFIDKIINKILPK